MRKFRLDNSQRDALAFYIRWMVFSGLVVVLIFSLLRVGGPFLVVIGLLCLFFAGSRMVR